MADIIGLHHIGVKCADAEVSKEFYGKLLGFENVGEFRKGESHLVFMKKGSCVIELIEKVGLEPIGAGQVDHVALTVSGIAEIVENLKANNVNFINDSIGYADWIYGGVDNIFFYGPDGERIELFEVRA